jgi:hypothetical protein
METKNAIDGHDSENETKSIDVRVPVFLTGIVVSEGVSYCMDGADYRIKTLVGEARLKPATPKVEEFLHKVVGKRTRVTIGGFPSWGPECSYINTVYAEPAHRTMERLEFSFE